MKFYCKHKKPKVGLKYTNLEIYSVNMNVKLNISTKEKNTHIRGIRGENDRNILIWE